MNALFLTQGRSLALFHDLYCALKRQGHVQGAGFFVADSQYYDAFRRARPQFEADPSLSVLKEWQIQTEARGRQFDAARLREYERRYGRPTLWDAVVADRRVFLGRRATYTQDYAPRLSHAQMLALLETTVSRLEELFERVRPDFVVSFICVTMGEYLGWRLAEYRGIPFLNLRPTRVKNYIYAGEDVLEPSARLEAAYRALLEAGGGDGLAGAAAYLEAARATHALYEGVVKPSVRPPEASLAEGQASARLPLRLGAAACGLLRHHLRYRSDHHVPDLLGQGVYRRLVKPWRARQMERQLRGGYVGAGQLPGLGYAFFPLHTEPEVTLLVYSKPFLNQIEVARLLAMSLPAAMKLVVKEHPWSVGKRKLSYYRKLLEIPNLVLAPPEMTARELVKHARLVAVISGSVALEALILRKPVITLGRAPFNFLPSTMLRHVKDLEGLSSEVAGLLEGHRHDELALQCYLAAVMENSVPVDLYSLLLGRAGAYSERDRGTDAGTERQRQIELLAAYLIGRLKGGGRPGALG